MSLAEMNARTAAVLEGIPRGSMPQNLFRMALQELTMNSLGPKPQIAPSLQAIQHAALRIVRQHYPSFTPTVRPN